MKRTSYVVICCVLISVTSVAGSQIKWTGAGADDSWCTPENWQNGKVPGSADIVILNPPPKRGPVIDCDVKCGEIRGPIWKSDNNQVVDIKSGNVFISGRWRFANRGKGVATINVSGGTVVMGGEWRCSDSGGTYGVINVTGGSVACKSIKIGDSGGGEINVGGTGLIDVDGVLDLGGSGGDMPLKINMTGGMIRVRGEFRCPSNRDRAGLTTVKLKGGQIQCGSFSHAGVAYSMDIEEGQLIIEGDVTEEMRQDIQLGYITAYGGKAKVQCFYDRVLERTVIASSLKKKAWNPYPADRAQQVRPDVTLTWEPAENGLKYNVYLGTTTQAVKDGAEPVAKFQKECWFKTSLAFGQTYYWRVDTIDKTGGVAEGAIWQFTTTDGKVSNPSPVVGAEAVPADVTLSWKGGPLATSHLVYIGTDYDSIKNAPASDAAYITKVVDGNTLKPDKLELGQTYYWRVDAVNEKWPDSPWKGPVWSFTVDSGKARNPKPVDKGQWTPTTVTLTWDPATSAAAHNIYFGDSADDVKDGAKPARTGLKENRYKVAGLKQAATYYWRVDEVYPNGEVVKGDIWQFSTVGMLDLKVDLAVPQWENRKQPYPGTAKPGWVIWASERWADMYMHNGVWFPSKDNGESPDKEGILGSGVYALLTTGAGGTGTVHAKGLCRGGLAGDMPPYGKPQGDPIANTYFYACDWGGPKIGDVLLVLMGLPAGEYELLTYHNHWEPCEQQTRNCHDCDCGMPPMPSVTANPLPSKPLPGYRNLVLPPGTDSGVTPIKNARNVKVTSVYSDDEVGRSVIRFITDGSGVLVIYEAPDNGYPDCARHGREGGRGIVNAFELKLVSWAENRP